tara:strand:+ start:13000 stop:14031 length:1032 start_codon:yes stop_codon:yes gene_type:complete
MPKKIKPDFMDYNDSFGIWKRRLYNNNGLHKLRFYDITRGTEFTFVGGVEDFSDSYTSNWTDDDVYGKQDPMAIFANTRRNISLSCVLPAYSFVEAEEILARCQLIASGMYPDYTRINGIKLLKTAPLWKVKWGNLITGGRQNYGTAKRSGLTCRIDSFEYTPDLEANVSVLGSLAPMVTRASFSLTPFHEHTAGTTHKKAVRHFPYNQRKWSDQGGIADRGMGDIAGLEQPIYRLGVDSVGLTITRVEKGKNKGKYMVITNPQKSSNTTAEGYIITENLANALKNSGYYADPLNPKKGVEDPRVPVSALRDYEEGRKVIKALQRQYIKQVMDPNVEWEKNKY